ncbi:hypothetical protein ESCO_006783 [Escovopsis weberi]|uniref:Moybdenum cofactor oxidoreductase dimerisation domain-containing protein n=1 Tax=Escovopsis weberi TaxID=150374 RepID=A0A0M8MYF5_ESCWE|nr:hypothetical protein ESCO_006783 [Escovopsis weberi]
MTPWHKEVVVHNGHIEVTGWAYSGGGRWPERVEVSTDGGRVCCHKVNIYSINAGRPATKRRLEEFQKQGESFLTITRPTKLSTMSLEEYEAAWATMEPRDVDE